MEEKKLNIYEKMLVITSELTRVAKNLEVGFGANKYKAVGEADILAAVKPLEEKYKVYSYPVKREIIETGELETKAGAKNLFLRIAVTYRFVNVEKPEEFIEVTSYGDGVDSQDKSVGKAMTYADKYALMKAYKIMTGDDPDQNMSEELKGKTPRNTQFKAENRPNSASSNPGATTTPTQPNQVNTGEKATEEQLAILHRQDVKVIDYALKLYGLATIDEISKKNADTIIQSMTRKGTLK